jgi:hypothetical protein
MARPGGGMKLFPAATEHHQPVMPQGTGRRTRHPRADHQPFGYAERSMAAHSVRLRSEMLQGRAAAARSMAFTEFPR